MDSTMLKQTDFLKTEKGWISDYSGNLVPTLSDPRKSYVYCPQTDNGFAATLMAEYGFRDATPERLGVLPVGCVITLTIYGGNRINRVKPASKPGLCHVESEDIITGVDVFFKGIAEDALKSLEKYPWKVEE